LDLDGVVWLGDEEVPGAAEAVARLRAAGERIVFVTNNSAVPVGGVEAKLAAHGIPAAGDVLTSALAVARLVTPGERVLVCGGPGVVEALTAMGAEVVTTGPVDTVVVGLARDLTYDLLRRTVTAVLAGARLLATNDDATYPTAAGPEPGAGAVLAAVTTASGAVPTIAGKPHRPMVELVHSHLGPTGIMVGDRPDTDGRMARALGYRFGLVLSGVTGLGDLPVDPPPDLVAADLGALVAGALGR